MNISSLWLLITGIPLFLSSEVRTTFPECPWKANQVAKNTRMKKTHMHTYNTNCTHTRAHTHILTHTSHTHGHTHQHPTRTYVRIHAHARARTCVHTRIHESMRTLYTLTHMCTRMHTQTATLQQADLESAPSDKLRFPVRAEHGPPEPARAHLTTTKSTPAT